MPTIKFLVENSPDLYLPNGIVGWLGWLAILGLNIYLLKRWWNYNQPWTKSRSWIFVFLIFLVPLTSILIPAIQLQPSEEFPVSILPGEPVGNLMIVFGAVPWFLAAGILGPAPAAALAFFSGVFIALWGTYNPFLPLNLALLASWLGMILHQQYRTLFFRLLRRPIIAAVALAVFYPVLFLITSFFTGQSDFTSRLDFTLTNFVQASISFGSSLLIAGIIAEVVSLAAPKLWGTHKSEIPSPVESKLSARFLFGLAPVALILLLILVIGDWIIAGRVAQNVVNRTMANFGKTVAHSVPVFLETGQGVLARILTDPRFATATSSEMSELLASKVREEPFFSQLILVDGEGKVVASHPPDAYESPLISQQELTAIPNVDEVPIQYFTIRPLPGSPAALVSYIAKVPNRDPESLILIGRSDLDENPYADSLLTNIDVMSEYGGEGMLVNEDNIILYHPDADKIWTVYQGETKDSAFFDEVYSPEGIRQDVYYVPAEGRPWSVVMSVPARYAQEQALGIALPLLGIIALFIAVALLFFRFELRLITASLQSLAVEAGRMSRGQLDQPLNLKGEDEVGQLSRAFEQMRSSLKGRLDELNRLLIVSQGVASTLDIREAMQPVLESALVTGATSARVVLDSSVLPDIEGSSSTPLRMGSGPSTEIFSFLDDQVVSLTRKQDQMKITNMTRPRLFTVSNGNQLPQAMLALALRNEDFYFGAFWVAYSQPHVFKEEEIRYLTTLASQAVIATANTRLFMTSELGRQRLEAILVSTPDAVLVTDRNDRLLLTNPAASKILGDLVKQGVGKPITALDLPAQLVNLLHDTSNEKQSLEVVLPNGRIYLANASSIVANERQVGRVCILRDITHFRELDTLKSDFVSTVSHDLRSPLTLIRGYSTMLQMVGELNDQQRGYLNKIMIGVDNMSRLVNNLLDLGRIEAGVGLQLEKKPVDEIVKNVISLLQLQANQKQIQLSIEIPDQDLPLIEADQALLQQALFNLVDNAIKYTDAGGKVVISVNMSQTHVEYAVRDNGIGIAPADQQRLFEKFYRGSRKGLKPERGSGLGLVIVKSIVERHGGVISVNSQLGRGSTFTFVVPLVHTTVQGN